MFDFDYNKQMDFCRHEARFVNKPLKIILLVLAALVLLVWDTWPMCSSTITGWGTWTWRYRQVLQPAETGREYHLLSYNIGFGAYEPDYGSLWTAERSPGLYPGSG